MPSASVVAAWVDDFFAAVGAPGKKAADFASADWDKAHAFMKSREVPRGGIAALSDALNVPRPTLSNRLRTASVSTLGRGRPTTLPRSAEILFAKRITQQNDVGHAWSPKFAHKKLKILAEHVEIGADAVKDPRALTRLIKRHGISKLVAEKTTASRALAMNKTAIAHHFGVLAAAGWKDAPAHLKFNFDETSLTDNNSKKEKVRVPCACKADHAHFMPLLYCALFAFFQMQALAPKGAKARTSGSPMSVHASYMPFICAAGTIPVHVLFIKGKRLFREWCEAWPEAYFIMTESGGIDNEAWQLVVDIMIDVLPTGAKIMADSHNSRDSDWRAELDLHRSGLDLSLSEPNTSDKTQPCDGPFFKKFKGEYHDILHEKRTDDGASLSILEIIKAAKAAVGRVPSSVITASFKNTGTHPFNPDIFTDKHFKAADITGKSLAAARMKAGLPPIPESIIMDPLAIFGPPVTKAWIEAKYDKKPRTKTHAVHLTGLHHIASAARKEAEEEAEEAAAAADKSAKIAARAAAKDESDKAKESRRVAKLEKKAEKEAAKAGRAKKRKAPDQAAAAPAEDDGGDDEAAPPPPLVKKARKASYKDSTVVAAPEPQRPVPVSKHGRPQKSKSND